MILSQPLAKAMDNNNNYIIMDHFLLDLSDVFDKLDHDNLFYILERYVGICLVHVWYKYYSKIMFNIDMYDLSVLLNKVTYCNWRTGMVFNRT